MDARRFVSAYPYKLPPEVVYRGDYPPAIQEAQGWSYQFGLFLHEWLRGVPPTHLTIADQHRYQDWAGHALSTMEATLLTIEPEEAALRARNEVNFHALNRRMLGLWDQLRNNDWKPSAHRAQTINRAQDSLAIDGLEHFLMRKKTVDEIGEHEWYDIKNEPGVATHVGVVQEFDAAVLLTDVMRHYPNLIIVPAPTQFERCRKHRNMDMVIIDALARRAIGAQIRTAVRQHDMDNADKERLIFIDGTTDLGNVRPIRIQRNRSIERVVPWPGIIAAKRVERIKAYGRHSAHIVSERDIVRCKLIAKALVGNIRLDQRSLSLMIGQRIMDKL